MKHAVFLLIALLVLSIGCSSRSQQARTKATKASTSALNLKDANQLLSQKRCPEAIALYQKFLEKYPDDSGAWNMIGVAYLCDNKPEMALSAFSKAIEITPTYTDVRNNLGIAHMEMKNYDAARMEFMEALEDNVYPQAGPYFNLAKLSFLQGNYEESRALAKKVMDLTPKQQQAGALLLYSLSLEKLKRYPEATTSYQELLKIAPDNLEASYCLGNVLVVQRQDCQARIYYQKVVDAAPLSEIGQKALQALKTINCPQ